MIEEDFIKNVKKHILFIATLLHYFYELPANNKQTVAQV